MVATGRAGVSGALRRIPLSRTVYRRSASKPLAPRCTDRRCRSETSDDRLAPNRSDREAAWAEPRRLGEWPNRFRVCSSSAARRVVRTEVWALGPGWTIATRQERSSRSRRTPEKRQQGGHPLRAGAGHGDPNETKNANPDV